MSAGYFTSNNKFRKFDHCDLCQDKSIVVAKRFMYLNKRCNPNTQMPQNNAKSRQNSIMPGHITSKVDRIKYLQGLSQTYFK